MESSRIPSSASAKPRFALVFTLLALAIANPLQAQEMDRDFVDPVALEEEVIASVKRAVGNDDLISAEATLTRPADSRMKGGDSVTLARRAMAVCGRLRNDNDLARSRRLAERVLARLKRMTETNDEDRVERLYWESCLLTGILDRNEEALALLEEAEALAPADERILQGKAQLARTVAQSGTEGSLDR